MQNPKFEIGEECWLVPERDPVTPWQRVTVLGRENYAICYDRSTGAILGSGLVYWTDPDPVGEGIPWHEDALRKINPDTNETCEQGWSLEKLKSKERAR